MLFSCYKQHTRNKMLKIAIVEDALSYQKLLQEYIAKYEKDNGEKFDVHVFSDGLDILDSYKSEYDIIFMDIQMKHLDGMETARKIREIDDHVIIIFITNMAQYAIQGYAVDALDYVLKPISAFAFAQQLEKAVKKWKERNNNFVTIMQDGMLSRIHETQISYVESQGHNILIHYNKGIIRIRSTMKEMEIKFSGMHFARCNNCYLVNLRYVEQMNQNVVTVAGEALQVSRPKKKAFMEALTDYVGGEM